MACDTNAGTDLTCNANEDSDSTTNDVLRLITDSGLRTDDATPQIIYSLVDYYYGDATGIWSKPGVIRRSELGNFVLEDDINPGTSKMFTIDGDNKSTTTEINNYSGTADVLIDSIANDIANTDATKGDVAPVPTCTTGTLFQFVDPGSGSDPNNEIRFLGMYSGKQVC
ncbi:MAG: hypothetical protein HC796_11680 [Synechococcaceae cyanobacterium RL_1_2]|nr:hypothetical protein [Synechococcaceae cyanobacterium RL_1_2]